MDKVSKNFKKDKLITNVHRIYELANEGKSIYVTRYGKLTPAAFLINWQARWLIDWANANCFYEVKRIDDAT